MLSKTWFSAGSIDWTSLGTSLPAKVIFRSRFKSFTFDFMWDFYAEETLGIDKKIRPPVAALFFIRERLLGFFILEGLPVYGKFHLSASQCRTSSFYIGIGGDS